MIAESYPSWFGPRVLFEDKATVYTNGKCEAYQGDIVDRMDAAVRLKRECDAYKAEREAR